MGLLDGKRGLIMGAANERSIAWGIAKAAAHAGAEIALSYQSEVLRKRLLPLADSIQCQHIIECDVANADSVAALFGRLGAVWPKLDFLVHSIGFSDKNQLRGRYIDTTRDNFLQSLDISVYSFTNACREAEKLMTNGGCCLTLTYYGAEKVIPHYNVMGIAKAALEASVRYLAVDMGGGQIRVNAISAGTVKTLAANGISDFRYIMKWNELNSPLRRNVKVEEIGNTAVYLLSDYGGGVTGEVLHVDAGYHIVGMKNVDAPDITKVV